MKKTILSCDIRSCTQEMSVDKEKEHTVVFLGKFYHLCDQCKQSCQEWVERMLGKGFSMTESQQMKDMQDLLSALGVAQQQQTLPITYPYPPTISNNYPVYGGLSITPTIGMSSGSISMTALGGGGGSGGITQPLNMPFNSLTDTIPAPNTAAGHAITESTSTF